VDFAFGAPRHQLLNCVPWRFAFVQYGVHLLGYGHFHATLTGKLHGGIRGVNTLGYHSVHARDNFRQFASAPEFDAHSTIARKASGACKNKVA